MKKAILIIPIVFILVSCDPVSSMDANIKNSTSQNLSIQFVTSTGTSETIRITSDETLLFREGMSTTGGFLEPSLIEFDSIYIVSESNEVLKIFKQDTDGKNIYNIDEYWTFSEPSKRFYLYDYEILNEDFE
ncbi:hypothetical protein [Costertonia aggregata]|uniref:Uncharacterized protein n=1 Tax=Costertonia aggregata TaxID=343403 RepID=A0A7H9AKI6_9FLAO|nr:hypothetical protein [Costertonia aggregata]QLG43927.1 hypothetical protein HYG79_00710 [Costertonia aggregata]